MMAENKKNKWIETDPTETTTRYTMCSGGNNKTTHKERKKLSLEERSTITYTHGGDARDLTAD